MRLWLLAIALSVAAILCTPDEPRSSGCYYHGDYYPPDWCTAHGL